MLVQNSNTCALRNLTRLYNNRAELLKNYIEKRNTKRIMAVGLQKKLPEHYMYIP